MRLVWEGKLQLATLPTITLAVIFIVYFALRFFPRPSVVGVLILGLFSLAYIGIKLYHG